VRVGARLGMGTAALAILATHGLSAQAFVLGPAHSTAGTFAIAGRSSISVYELAAAWAPVLWFSDYEPLLQASDRIPSIMPTDTIPPIGLGVVYYRATVITPRGGAGFQAAWDLATEDAPPTVFEEYPSPPSGSAVNPGCPLATDFADPSPDCLHLNEIGLVRLQYLFYFPNDVGGGGHEHDLEIAELWFRVIDLFPPYQYVVALDRIIGYAHGAKGFANRLNPGLGSPIDPLAVPVVLFIERGKHAPSPDRTRDGVFTPGFDVNEMVADAWGIRDVFGSQWLGKPSYSSWMTLGRGEEHEAIFVGMRQFTDPPNSWAYELRDFKPSATASDAAPDLQVYLDHHEYASLPRNGPDRFMGLKERFGVGGRIDLGLGPYLSWTGFGVPLIGGQVVATATGGLTFTGNGAWYGFSVFYSPMIAGFFNVYGGATSLWCPSCSTGSGFGPEAGIKLRIPIPHPPAPDFVGIRIGLRYSSFKQMGSPRLLAEVGLATP